MSELSVEENWQRIDYWLKTNAPEILKTLNGPASNADLELLENHTNSVLPDDFKSSLLVHNGQSIDGPALLNLHMLLPVEQIVEAWDMHKEVFESTDFEGIGAEEHPKVKSDLWNTSWIPFTSDFAGDYMCVDLDPNVSGHIGQVFLKGDDHPARTCLARSYNSWLQKLAAAMTADSSFDCASGYGICLPYEEG